MATSIRLLVTERFEDYLPGMRITLPSEIKRVHATYPQYVLREHVSGETQPTKADVKAAGLPTEAALREAVGLPPGPLDGPVRDVVAEQIEASAAAGRVTLQD
jgi:hypothetical protein